MAVKSENVRPPKQVDNESAEEVAAETLVKAVEELEDLTKQKTGGKILVKMERENMSFVSDDGVKFTQEAPFQLVTEEDAELLFRQNFRRAWPDELKDFYKKK